MLAFGKGWHHASATTQNTPELQEATPRQQVCPQKVEARPLQRASRRTRGHCPHPLDVDRTQAPSGGTKEISGDRYLVTTVAGSRVRPGARRPAQS